MGCNCAPKRRPMVTEYELTKPTGEKTTYSNVTEARMQRSLAGGGTIRTIRTPITT